MGDSHLKFTFGIITAGSNNPRESTSAGELEIRQRILEIISSIEEQNMPLDCYEIVVIGGNNFYKSNEKVTHINFDETLRKGWITKKKNLITSVSKFNNIVYLHDYIKLEKGWYDNFIKFGDNWDVCMTSVVNIEGGRWIDWISRTDERWHVLLPYLHKRTPKMYVSGAYWIAKKKFMQKFPLNENLLQFQGEDIEWSDRWMSKENVQYLLNQGSTVRCIKEGKKYSPIFYDKQTCLEGLGTTDVDLIVKKWYTGPNGEDWLLKDFPWLKE
jgi:hypothetical protein